MDCTGKPGVEKPETCPLTVSIARRWNRTENPSFPLFMTRGRNFCVPQRMRSKWNWRLKYLHPESDEWRAYWSLYSLLRLAVKDRQKLFEADYASPPMENPS